MTYIQESFESTPNGRDVTEKKRCWYEFETDIKWGSTIFIISLHILSIYYFITFPYLDHKFLVVWTLVMYHLTGLGTTAGVHRLWTHRSYKAKLPLRIILAALFYSSGQNRIYDWVRDHRVHHKYTDTEADPHNASRGFGFSHVGWLMLKKKPEVIQRGRGIDMSDIQADPVVVFFDKHHVFLKIFLTFVLPVLIPVYGFNQDLKWSAVSQIFLRYPWLLNTIWSINSFAHMFGYRSYDKSIQPTENIWLGFAAGGEGWHNYHHVFPWDYKAAELRSIFLNATGMWIETFAKIGWAYDLKQASPQYVKKVLEKRGDGTHALLHEAAPLEDE